jgi:hypothetical protein
MSLEDCFLLKTHEGLAKAIQIFEGIDDGALDE